MAKESWKDVVGYEGMYQVSNLGQVRSLDRVVNAIHPNSGTVYPRKLKGKVLSLGEVRGYLTVTLTKNNEQKQFRVNRLVAQTFIPNPNSLPQVGHDDDNKQNNRVDNLYWTDATENNTHNDKHLRVGKKLSKPIIGIKDNGVIMFDSSVEAGKYGFNSSAIRNCLTGRSKTHNGYRWEYAEVV